MSYRELWQPLLTHYEEREARAVVLWLLDVVFGLSQTAVVCGAVERLPDADLERLQAMMVRLRKGEPVQYVAGMADFGPRQFHVEPGVLIPRPETYGLCQWITKNGDSYATEGTHAPRNILDIGTGSGCIACTLALDIRDAQVTAWDISETALAIAADNAQRLGAQVAFQRQDALTPPTDKACWDVIVSNPPYICEQEQAGMQRHVLDFEPQLALFVPDDDPLRFYRAIGRYALTALRPGGSLFFELNAAYANETKALIEQTGFSHVHLRDDQFDRPRFLQATP